MPKRVVFFLDSVFNTRDYVRFGFEIIRARGYAVEAWDFSPFLRPDYYQSYVPPDPTDFDGHRLFMHLNQIVDAVSGLSNEDIVVCMIGLDRGSAFIFELLGEKNLSYGFCILGTLPQASTSQRIKIQLHRLTKKPGIFLGKVFNRLRLKGNAWMGRSQYAVFPRFMMVGGRVAANDRRCSVLEPEKVIKAHAFDYDRYLEEGALTHIDDGGAAGSYALFLDEDVPFHLDYALLDIDPYCVADKYYDELNKYFDFLERMTGLSVIVAAHPRADYGKRGNPYGNRRLVYGETIFYTKHAKLILAHASTSRNFAILYKKPVLFMDSLEYCMPLREEIRIAAAALGQQPLIISDASAYRLPELTVNDELYERYKHSHIKESGTPNKMSWDIFCDYLDEQKQQGDAIHA